MSVDFQEICDGIAAMACVISVEKQESGYGKNVDYLIEIVEPEIVRGENLK